MSATCKGCGGVADYAFMDGDVICKKCLAVGAKAKPSDYARAMIEMGTLRTQSAEQAERIRELEASRAICPECAKKIDEVAGVDIAAKNRENQQLRAALVSARGGFDTLIEDGILAVDCGYGTLGVSHVRKLCESSISKIDAILSGQPVEDPRDKVIEKCRHILSGIKLYRAFNGDDWPAREAEEALAAIEQLKQEGV